MNFSRILSYVKPKGILGFGRQKREGLRIKKWRAEVCVGICITVGFNKQTAIIHAAMSDYHIFLL